MDWQKWCGKWWSLCRNCGNKVCKITRCDAKVSVGGLLTELAMLLESILREKYTVMVNIQLKMILCAVGMEHLVVPMIPVDPARLWSDRASLDFRHDVVVV